MSQEQYNALMSSLLKEKYALAKLREELEGRKGKLCRNCKGFGHLARNCRNRREGEKGAEMPQNKFEILRNRVMQCGVEERVVRSTRTVVVKCFKCEEERHKCRECPLWERKSKRVVRPKEGKAHQGEKKLRRVEEGEAARLVQGKAQQGWKKSSMEELRKRAEEHCGEGILEEAQFFELGWCIPGMIVTYTKCRGYGRKGSYAEDDRGQGVLRDRTFWCGCKRKEGGASTERKSAARVEKVVRPREAKVQQSGARSGEPESTAREGGS